MLSARLRIDAGGLVEGMLDAFGIDTVPFTAAHWSGAISAFVTYGRGRHPAALNLGDVMTYAVASLADEPLLFIGDDSTLTDLRAA